MKLTKELEQLKYELNVLREVECSYEEAEIYRERIKNNKSLPEGVLCRNPDGSVEYMEFYRVEKTALSKDELSEYIQYKQLQTLITIKKCVVFFTTLTIISLVCSAIAALVVLCA